MEIVSAVSKGRLMVSAGPGLCASGQDSLVMKGLQQAPRKGDEQEFPRKPPISSKSLSIPKAVGRSAGLRLSISLTTPKIWKSAVSRALIYSKSNQLDMLSRLP